MAAKLSLIDTELLLRLLEKNANRPPPLPMPPAHPILREMNAIDGRMQGTLDDPGLSDLSKSQKINSLLSKHDNFTRQFENQPPPTVNVELRPDPDMQDDWYAKIVQTVPVTVKQKARNLLDYIKSSKNIQWDRDGRIVIDNAPVPETNVLDLVHSVTRTRKSMPVPKGTPQFLKALDKINTPKELLPNAETLRRQIEKSSEAPRLFSPVITPKAKKRKRRRTAASSRDDARDDEVVNFDLWQNDRS